MNSAVARAQAIVGGIEVGTGAISTATVDPTVRADIGDGGRADVDTDVILRSRSEGQTLATSTGTTGAVIAAGGSVSDATDVSDVDAAIGAGAVVTSGSRITLQALHNYDTDGSAIANRSRAMSKSTAGAIVAASGADADAIADADVDATVAVGAQLSAGGDVSLSALSNNDAFADSRGIQGGLVGVGTSSAEASANGDAAASMNGSVLDANGLQIVALAANKADADSSAVSGGVFAGAGSYATANARPEIYASIGDGASAAVGGGVTIRSQSEMDADSDARGVEGGEVTLGESTSSVFVDPDIATFIGAGAVVDAGLDIVLETLNGQAVDVGDGSFTPSSDVSTGSDTITDPSRR